MSWAPRTLRTRARPGGRLLPAAGRLQKRRGLGLLLCKALGAAGAVAHLARELAARSVDVVPSRLADRRHDARLVEAAAERENLLALGLAQVRLREGIEGNQVELARHVFTAHEFDEFVGLLKAIVDAAEHDVLEGDEVARGPPLR